MGITAGESRGRHGALSPASPDVPHVTTEELQDLYRQLNETYFDGQLPEYRVEPFVFGPFGGSSGECFRTERVIRVDLTYFDPVEIILLHEMVHVRAGYGHDFELFGAEIRRLIARGAPVGINDLGDFGGSFTPKEREIIEEYYGILDLVQQVRELRAPAIRQEFERDMGATMAEEALSERRERRLRNVRSAAQRLLLPLGFAGSSPRATEGTK